MLSYLLSLIALAAPTTGDVTAARTVTSAPSAVYAKVTDVAELQKLFPTDCARDWKAGAQAAGLGASFDVTYWAGPMRRPLTGHLTAARDGRLADWDHDGKKGFTTRWTIEPDGDGSKVTITTYLNPPPWPLKRAFFKRVHPEWTRCYERVLAAL